MSGHLALAQVKQAQADTPGALETLGEAEKFAQQNNLPSWGIRLAAHRVRLWLAQNDLTAAERWLQKEWLDLSSDSADDSAGYPHELRQAEQLAQARLLIAQNRAGEALALLVPLHQMVEAKGRTGCVLEILLLQALAHQAQDDVAQAKVVLEKALALAERDGHIRLFVDEGPAMAKLLEKMKADETMREYTGQLLAAFAKEETVAPSSVLIEPLSDRELEVLHLIAAGSSNQQIAEELVLTVGTVKWHLSNIYSKLGVNSRTQAVAQARELRLL
jgi:LuxR family maltose regulon positive regulatory protein